MLDVTIVVAGTALDDEGAPYAVTQIYRLDLDGDSARKFLAHVAAYPGVVEMNQLSADVAIR